LFLAASQFPKHRETRAPTIAELKSVKDKLDEKYLFLLDAPETDPEGNAAIVRFSRKSKSQYVMSEKDGKPTGWVATFDGKQWKAKADAAAGDKPAKGKTAAAKTTKAAAKKKAAK